MEQARRKLRGEIVNYMLGYGLHKHKLPAHCVPGCGYGEGQYRRVKI